MRLGKRERAALAEAKALAYAKKVRADMVDDTPIRTSMGNAWPIGKPRVDGFYNGRTAARIHRRK